MKHFVSIVHNDDACACFAYHDKAAAVAKFHTEMAYAANANVTTLCIVVNSNGSVICSEKYTAAATPEAGEDNANVL